MDTVITVRISKDLLNKAHSLGIPLSETAREGIRVAVEKQEQMIKDAQRLMGRIT
jgi:post-segregation antitoxin (ccd killing protein)